MVARVIELADVRLRLAGVVQEPAQPSPAPAPAYHAPALERFHFWCGASGESYVHTVYRLIDCPAVPASNYVLVRRSADGSCVALGVGTVAEEAPSLNLARLRQQGATLGANEVHVHLLAGTPRQAKLVEFDLRSAYLTAASAEAQPLLH